jgi:hypothetical protein
MAYMAEPSPMTPMTFLSGLASAMPTEAGRLWPSPPLHMVKKVSAA